MGEHDESASTREVERSKGEEEPSPETTNGGWSFEAQAHYDPTEKRELATVIVGAIAEAEGVSITEVLSPPLYDVVDVAAIETALFGRRDVSGDGTESTVEFRYNEYMVSLDTDGWVTVSMHADEDRTD